MICCGCPIVSRFRISHSLRPASLTRTHTLWWMPFVHSGFICPVKLVLVYSTVKCGALPSSHRGIVTSEREKEKQVEIPRRL